MGCYQSPDGQRQFGNPEGETSQFPGSVHIRTQIPLVKLEICLTIPGQPVRLHSLLLHAQLHRTLHCRPIDQRADIPLHLRSGSVSGRASGFSAHVCRNGLRLTGCRAVPDGQDVKRIPSSALAPRVFSKRSTNGARIILVGMAELSELSLLKIQKFLHSINWERRMVDGDDTNDEKVNDAKADGTGKRPNKR